MRKLWIFTLVLSIVMIIVLSMIYIFRENVVLTLKGKDFNIVVVNSSFVDEGIEAYLFKKDISDLVKITSNLDVNKIGEYNIYYNLNFLRKEYNVIRKIIVIDDEKPSISLKGEKYINLYVGDSYVEQGAVAIDNYDGDITSNINILGKVDTSKEGTYELKYAVNDSSGNENSVVRSIVVSKKVVVSKPLINCVNFSDNYSNDDEIIKYIKDNDYKISVGYYNLVNGSSYFYQANKIYYGASLIKTLDILYLYNKKMLSDSLEPYINKTISISDNDAHHYLVNYIGRENLKQYGLTLGACNTLTDSGYYGNTTVSDQIVYLKKLYEISKNDEKLQSYFINDYGNFLKFDNIDVMHKYGYYDKYYHDVGIVLDDEPYIVVVLTEHGNDSVFFRKKIINETSRLIYNYHHNNS